MGPGGFSKPVSAVTDPLHWATSYANGVGFAAATISNQILWKHARKKHIDTETHRHTQTDTYGFIRNLRPISVTVPYVTKLYVQNKKRVQNMELA